MSNWYQEHRCAMTPEDREAAYAAWAANTPEWITPNRELWMQRYQRPAPPASVTVKTLAEIRGEHNEWTQVHEPGERRSDSPEWK